MADNLSWITGTVTIDGAEVVDADVPLEFPTVKEFMERWGAKLIIDLKNSAKQHKASGALESSITYDVEFRGEFLELDLLLNDYYKYLDEGVKGSKYSYGESASSPFAFSNKMPPFKAIAKWVGNKGIYGVAQGKQKKASNVSKGRSLVFMIQKRIFEHGIQATGFYSKVVNEKRIEDLRDDLIDAFGEDLLKQI